MPDQFGRSDPWRNAVNFCDLNKICRVKPAKSVGFILDYLYISAHRYIGFFVISRTKSTEKTCRICTESTGIVCRGTRRNIPLRFDITMGSFDRFRSEGPHLAIPPLPGVPPLPWPDTSPPIRFGPPPGMLFCNEKLPAPIWIRQFKRFKELLFRPATSCQSRTV